MRLGLMLGCLGLMLSGGAFGAEREDAAAPTYYKDVLPILQENCQLCHRDKGANFGGMVAPMALQDYAQARAWSKAIAREVSAKKMPPWGASPEQHGQFKNERTLDEGEIATLVRWVESGAKRGNADDAPATKEWSDTDGWLIGKPDVIIRMPEKFFVEDDVEDLYVDFAHEITEETIGTDRWIAAVEFRAGSKAVHHIIARPLGGMAPGYDPIQFRPGYGRELKVGSTLNWEMHYHKEAGEGTGVWDQSEAGVIFWPEGTEIHHAVATEPLGSFRFRIPAGDSNYSHHTSFEVPDDILVLAYNPHMHLRGKSARYVAAYPDGREEVLLDVPRYDFNWQITYTYAEPKLLPKGTVVNFTTAWDNGPDNPVNPDPTRDVTWGRPTTDEMMFGWMQYTGVDEKHIVVGGGSPEETD